MRNMTVIRTDFPSPPSCYVPMCFWNKLPGKQHCWWGREEFNSGFKLNHHFQQVTLWNLGISTNPCNSAITYSKENQIMSRIPVEQHPFPFSMSPTHKRAKQTNTSPETPLATIQNSKEVIQKPSGRMRGLERKCILSATRTGSLDLTFRGDCRTESQGKDLEWEYEVFYRSGEAIEGGRIKWCLYSSKVQGITIWMYNMQAQQYCEKLLLKGCTVDPLLTELICIGTVAAGWKVCRSNLHWPTMHWKQINPSSSCFCPIFVRFWFFSGL